MSSTSASLGEPAATVASRPPPGRWQRSAAVLIDLSSAALTVAVAACVATLWLLARTAWGRDDAGSGDALIATALVLAALPAWATWQVVRVRRGDGTAGQARVALTVTLSARAARVARSARTAATVRLACHPVAVTAWLWLTALALLLGANLLALASAAAAALWALAGLVSAVAVLRDPAARALHDRLAGTSLVRR